MTADVPGIQRNRLADQAYEWIKERILTRQMLPGDRLSVPALADTLGLSRSPVREAVQRLVQEGLGTERPHQGAVVATADLRSLVDLYTVRAALEGLSAELAVRADDVDLLADLEAIHVQHRTAYDAGARADVIRADVRFHARLVAATGNPELERTLEPILQRMTLAMLAGGEHWPNQALAEHQAVLDAVRDRQPAAARDSMEQHVLRVRSSLMSVLTTSDGDEST